MNDIDPTNQAASKANNVIQNFGQVKDVMVCDKDQHSK